MIWKDAHSKLSEEKHIAKQCGIVTFLFKKKKNPNWYLYRKASGNLYSKVLMDVVSE